MIYASIKEFLFCFNDICLLMKFYANVFSISKICFISLLRQLMKYTRITFTRTVEVYFFEVLRKLPTYAS